MQVPDVLAALQDPQVQELLHRVLRPLLHEVLDQRSGAQQEDGDELDRRVTKALAKADAKARRRKAQPQGASDGA